MTTATTTSIDTGISIVEDPEAKVWQLSTAGSTLIVGLDDTGAVVQRYWGPRLPAEALADFRQPDRLRWNSSFQRPAEIDEQLPVDGGQRWSVPSLQVTFEGGIRSLELSFDAVEVSRHADSADMVVSLVDRGFDLTVCLHYRLKEGTDVIERWTSVLHGGVAGDVAVSRADSGNWLMPDLPHYRTSTVHGYWSAETQLERHWLPTGEYTLTSRHGTTGQQSNPWIMVDDGTATEAHGAVYTVALAWSGSWRLTAQRRPEGGASVTAGFGHEGLRWNLAPGQSLVTPSALGLYHGGGFGGTSRAWHQYTRRHVLPRSDEERPVLFNSWEATGFEVTEEGQSDLARRAAKLGVELFVVDDGWFGGRTHDAAGLGDWTPNPDRFPHGLHGLVNTVRGLGMKFGLWVEPEMVNPDSDLYRSHPDWVLHWPHRRREERRRQLVLNFARADVRQWALEVLGDLVSTYSLDFIKWDMNRPFTQAGWPENPHQQDMLWIEHTRGVYHIMDRLRQAHPNLRIESCSSGGGRVDLGVLARTDQVWTSDNTDSMDRQVIQHGYSQLYPAIAMGAWVTETVNDMTGRWIPLDYRFHVAMAGALGIGGNLFHWSDAELRRAAGHIAMYKRIRGTVHHGDQYRFGDAPGRGFSALEYVRDDQVVVFAYEPHRSLSNGPRRLQLQGLDPVATYRDINTGETTLGAVLMGRGVLANAQARQGLANTTRFSTADYASSLTVYERLLPALTGQ